MFLLVWLYVCINALYCEDPTVRRVVVARPILNLLNASSVIELCRFETSSVAPGASGSGGAASGTLPFVGGICACISLEFGSLATESVRLWHPRHSLKRKPLQTQKTGSSASVPLYDGRGLTQRCRDCRTAPCDCSAQHMGARG